MGYLRVELLDHNSAEMTDYSTVCFVAEWMAYLWDEKRAESMALHTVVEMDGPTVGD